MCDMYNDSKSQVQKKTKKLNAQLHHLNNHLHIITDSVGTLLSNYNEHSKQIILKC